jgi:hypothetical protein
MKLSEVEIPATAACRAALEVATAYCSPALLNQSGRAYLWAAAGEFVACFREQAARKPASRAAQLVASGLAARVAANPLDR